ncbi:hypothetical protein [Psychromonas sp. Urea-02u-13]|uniref:hypothetical protein n=1 Tax=Psychromonas sp. Urea-02u-13 TaxID=2058326 RepID=UPI000C3424C8|nr:hypothetical protein [Psychromonas sp. Urea-02u-13]PKG38721.1 hypothetical protein CXF74_12265 [Psychromonas sp. Urea-02u-13]
MLTKSRVVQLLFMLAVLLFLFFWRTFDSEQSEPAVIEQNVLAQISLGRCDYTDSCEFITEQGTFLLAIKNAPIQAEEWIDFELTTPLENSEITKAQIVGKTMFMGRIPVRFKKSAEKTFSAKGIVGACTTDQMLWELQITVLNGDKSELLTFDFMVNK